MVAYLSWKTQDGDIREHFIFGSRHINLYFMKINCIIYANDIDVC